jgi:23S rRNA-/tRNA-specific pseudouridylate synthase
LQYILNEVYAPARPKAAHRLDANTTGVVVFSKTRHYAGLLQPQFTRGEVQKTYLVRVMRSPTAEEFICDAPISVEPGKLGSRDADEVSGQSARTEFRVVKRFEDGTTLLEARPITGRTNQIRIHARKLGLSVVGDQAYREGDNLGDTQTLSTKDQPLCLHSWKITFTHPLTKERVTFECPPPSWASVAELQPVNA